MKGSSRLLRSVTMKKTYQTAVRWVIYRITVLIVRVFGALPLGPGAALGGLIGRAVYHVLARDRRRALENLAIAFPGEDPRRLRAIAKKMFENFGRGFVELTHIRDMMDHLADHVDIRGRQHVDGALREGKGLLWITAHIGNWELMAAAFARSGYPINVVARPLYDPRLGVLLEDFRSRNRVRTISRGDGFSTREIFRSLKRNELLGLLIDQDTKVQGIFVDFFGRKAFTPSGAAEIALRTGCPVVAGFIHRMQDGRHEIVVSPPIPLERTGDWDRDVAANTQRYTSVIEKEIRKCPEDWVWIHKRWHRRPSGEASLPKYGE